MLVNEDKLHFKGIMKKKSPKKKSSLLKRKLIKRKKNPDLETIKSQIAKLDNKKVAVISDNNIYGILDYKDAKNHTEGVPEAEWFTDIEIRINDPYFEQDYVTYGFNYSDIVRIDGRRIFINKNPEFIGEHWDYDQQQFRYPWLNSADVEKYGLARLTRQFSNVGIRHDKYRRVRK